MSQLKTQNKDKYLYQIKSKHLYVYNCTSCGHSLVMSERQKY